MPMDEHDNEYGRLQCPRCGNKSCATMMSMFNTQQVCIDCIEREQNHPKYSEAREAVIKEEEKGNYEYQGIGCPSDLILIGKE